MLHSCPHNESIISNLFHQLQLCSLLLAVAVGNALLHMRRFKRQEKSEKRSRWKSESHLMWPGRPSSTNHIWNQEETQGGCLGQEGESAEGKLGGSYGSNMNHQSVNTAHSHSSYLVFFINLCLLWLILYCAQNKPLLEDTRARTSAECPSLLNDSSVWYLGASFSQGLH